MARFGGETPQGGELILSVEPPAGTSSAAPVLEGEFYKLGGTAGDGSGYKAAALLNTDDPKTCVMLQALHRIDDINGALGVRVIGSYHQVRRGVYEGSPTIGQSIDAGTTSQKKIEGVTWADGQGYITYVDTTSGEVEFVI